TISLRIAGATSDGARARYAVMDIAAAQDRFARSGKLTRIDLRLRSGADRAIAQRRIQDALPAGVVAVAPASSVDAAMRLSRAYRINLNVLALVALFTGGLLVFSTQALAVTRRRGPFALVRTLAG